MRKLFLAAVLAVFAVPAAAADADTVCAMLYTYLSGSTRTTGSSGTVLDLAALKAEDAHLRRNPTEDRQRYARDVMDGAQSIQDGLAQGRIAQGTIDLTTARCNSHYFPEVASQQLAFPDDWWGRQQ